MEVLLGNMIVPHFDWIVVCPIARKPRFACELLHMRPRRGARYNARSRACSVNELLTVCEHGDLTVSSAVVLAQQTASARKAGAFLCVPSMIDSLGWKSSVQPDGGEGLAKRKDVVARRGLKEASPIGPPSDNPSGRRQQRIGTKEQYRQVGNNLLERPVHSDAGARDLSHTCDARQTVTARKEDASSAA